MTTEAINELYKRIGGITEISFNWLVDEIRYIYDDHIYIIDEFNLVQGHRYIQLIKDLIK